jgi:hypothetical protein
VNIKTVLPFLVFLAACSTQTPDENKTSAMREVPHPDAIAAVQWKIGDTCVNEYVIGLKKSVHTAVVTDVSNGRITFSDTADDGSVRVIIYEGTDSDHTVKGVSVANGQQLEFTPSFQWASFPLKPGAAWTSKSYLKGQTFQLDLTSKFTVAPWETVAVPAGRSNKGGSFDGSGTHTYWMAPDVKCPVKRQFKDSFGDRATMQLLSYKYLITNEAQPVSR